MRTTINLDDSLIASAAEFSGIKDNSKLVHFVLETYVRKMSAKRLASLGGSMPDFVVPSRQERNATAHMGEPVVPAQVSRLNEDPPHK